MSPMRGPEAESEDDDDTPQKKVAAATTTSPNNYSANRMTPWISKFVVEELKKGNGDGRPKNHTNRSRMIEILSRGGDFWDPNTYYRFFGPPPGWLLVSDGEYSIQVELDQWCRFEIWKQCQSEQSEGANNNNMYTYWNYSRGSCGILQDFFLQINGSTNRCELKCRSFQSQPQLKNMIVTKNTIIRHINECVHVRYALQSHDDATTTTTTTTSVARRGLVKGNVRQALQNDDLMNAIMQKTNEAIEAEKQRQREWDQQQERREQERQLQQQQVEDDESEDTNKFETQLQDCTNYVCSKDNEIGGDKDIDDDDDDESSCMNIQEMLETQAEDMEVESPAKDNEESKGQVEEEEQVSSDETMQKREIMLEHQSPGQPSQQQEQEGETQEEEEEEEEDEEETEKTIKEKEEAHGRKRKTTDTQLPPFRRPSRLPLFASFVHQLEDDSISTIVIIDPASQRKEG